jgi:hypothetical protein
LLIEDENVVANNLKKGLQELGYVISGTVRSVKRPALVL